MNDQFKKAAVPMINIRAVIWDLLTQWKAVLVVALIVMVLLTGLKYSKDMKAYKANEEKAAAVTASGLSVEERIDNALSVLSSDERTTVEFLVNEDEWISTEKEYVNKSILVNSNPANQRTLILDYYIESGEGTPSKMTSLVYSFGGYMGSDNMIRAAGQVIAPDAESKYIAELISANNGNSQNGNGDRTFVTNTDENSAVIELRIALPESTDAKALEKAVTAELRSYSSELDSRIAVNSISLIRSGESYLYNADAVTKLNNIMQSIYNMTNNSKNMQSLLSDSQKAAYETVKAIKRESETAEKSDTAGSIPSSEASPKPGLSKKYALLGFVLGTLMYAFIYLLLVIFRGCINSAEEAGYYIKSRLLGEVYSRQEHKGFDALLHSRFIDKIRYKNKLNQEVQEEKAADSIEAMCDHLNLKDVSLLKISDDSEGLNCVIKHIITVLGNHGITVRLFEINDINEKEFLDIENAVYVVNNNTIASALISIASMCNEFDITTLGAVYIKEI